MTLGEIVYVLAALLAVVGICSLPMFGSLLGAGPRYRAVILRQLVIGWISSALGIGWLILGWFALIAGRSWMEAYFGITLVLMGAFFPLLFIGIRAANSLARAAQMADRELCL